MTHPIVLIGFGIIVGVFSGLMGLGGGAVMIPIMVLAIGLEQTKAHGMSLMVMIPPVALPAVLGYFQRGALETKDIWMAMWIAIGLFCGSYFGSQIAVAIGQHKGALATVFGLLLVYVAMYTALGKANIARSVFLSLIVTLVAGAVVLGTRWWDARAVNSIATTPDSPAASG